VFLVELSVQRVLDAMQNSTTMHQTITYVFVKVKIRFTIHSFHFISAFPLGRDARTAILERLEIPHNQTQCQILLLVPYKDETK